MADSQNNTCVQPAMASCVERSGRGHRASRSTTWVVLSLVLAAGCTNRELATLNPKVSRVFEEAVGNNSTADVDLLLVIDNSGSMEAEQALLEEEIPRLVRELTSPPDNNGDGEPDWNPAETVQVAVVTTDLGTNGFNTQDLGGCGIGRDSQTNDVWGDNGRLLSCGASPITRWETGNNVDAFVQQVSCAAVAGIGGCGFEQPLEAAVRGLANAQQNGFPREDSLLAVLVLTDEEDCSVADPAGFYTSLPADASIARHCIDNEHLLRSVDELVAGIQAARSGPVLFSAIAGIPVDLAEADASPETILADPRMDYVVADTEVGLAYVCTSATPDGELRSQAAPARRVLQLATQFEDSLVRSICEEDFGRAIEELTKRIGARITDYCLVRGPQVRDDGSFCELLDRAAEVLLADASNERVFKLRGQL
ncbi:MAG: hypothetical protein AAGF12_37650, partial [Myxococcota bacterium]